MSRKKILAGLLSALTLLGSKASGQPVGIKSSNSSGQNEGIDRAVVKPSSKESVNKSSVNNTIKKGSSSKKVYVPEFSGESFGLKKESSDVKKPKGKNNKSKSSKIIEERKNAKTENLEKRFAIVQSSMEKDRNLQSLMQSGLSSDVLVKNLKYIVPTLLLVPPVGVVGNKIAKYASAHSVKYEYKAPTNINVDMSPVVSLGKGTSIDALVGCWLKCWKEYNEANNGKTIGALSCQDGDEKEKTLGESFDDALSKSDWKTAMKIYSKSPSLEWLIMPTVPTGSMFGPMYVYFADNDKKGYKDWDALLDNKDLKVYDISKYILSDMIQAFADYLVLPLSNRKKEESINHLLLRIYRFFVVYFHLDIKGISPLGFGLLNGKHLGIDIGEGGKIVLNNDKIKPYGMSGSLTLNAVKSLLWEFFNEANKKEDKLTVNQFKKSMNWLFGWVYYLKWLGESGTIGEKASVVYHVARGERPTEGTDISKLHDTALGEAKKRNDMINSLFGLVDSNCSAVELLQSFSGLVKKKDDIHEITENDIDRVADKVKKDVGVGDVKPALNKFLGFLSGSEFKSGNEVGKN